MEFLTASGLNQACPYATQVEIDKVNNIARKLRANSSVVMIGCGPAVFGLAVLESIIYETDFWIIDRDPNMFGYARAHFEGAKLRPMVLDRVIFVEGLSEDIGRAWSKTIDFLIVDGDHSYEGVKTDLEVWLPLVKKGGMIFIHDYLERAGGFNGIEPWHEGGCAKAVCERIADGSMMSHGAVGIGIVCERL